MTSKQANKATMMPKAKAKSQIQGRKMGKEDLDASLVEEMAQWDAVTEEEEWQLDEVLLREGEPTRQECLEADVQSLQTRLLNMEDMLQQVVSHIQATASKKTSAAK